MSDLAGRAALVTGASRGIGFATAAALVAAGARVALLARGERELRDAVNKLGDTALAVPGDVADPRSVREAIDRVRRAFGRLDLLVVNAAVAALGPVETTSDADVARQVGTNLLGAVWCARAAIPALRDSRGRVVFVSSDAAQAPFPRLAVYSASKAALEAFAVALRGELRPAGVAVSVLRAGPTATGFARDFEAAAFREALDLWRSGGQLAGGVLAAETVAASIVHLATRPPGAEVEVLDLRPTAVP